MSEPREVCAFAPASVSNLGPGFDVLGLAFDAAGDRVRARRSSTPGVRIVAVHGDGGVLPTEAERNTAGVAAISTLRRAGVEIGVELVVEKGLPIGSGLGSSAASAVAAAYAVNALIGGPLRKRDLVEPCLDAEALVAGRHADNIAPSLLGGLVLVRRLDPLDVVRLPVPPGLWVAVSTPDFVLETRVAREALPTEVPLGQMVRQSADLGGLVHACHTGDVELLARCITDEVVAPRRMALIPGGEAAVEAARGAGALGSSVSGAGPSVFALCRSERHAEQVGAAMAAAFREAGLGVQTSHTSADCPGVRPW